MSGDNYLWFGFLLVSVVLIALVSKSLVANLAVMAVATVGIWLVQGMEAVPVGVVTGMTAMFIGLIGFAVFQLFLKVEHI